MTRDPHYEDGPRYIGGAELPRVADTRETRPICGAEPDGLRSGVRHNRVCWLPQGHARDHLNRMGECWQQAAKSYREGFWRRLNAAKAATTEDSSVVHMGESSRCIGRPALGHAGSTPASLSDPYNPDDRAWETQDRVWEEEEAAERFETSARGIRAALND